MGDEDERAPGESEGDKTKTGILQELSFLRPKKTQRSWLIAVGGSHSVGKLFPLEDGMIIGRAGEADIVLEEDGVSRKHARVGIVAGAVRIMDLDSSNGVRVDGVQGKVLSLRDGQRLRVGDATLSLVRLDDDTAMIRQNLLESIARLDQRSAPTAPRR